MSALGGGLGSIEALAEQCRRTPEGCGEHSAPIAPARRPPLRSTRMNSVTLVTTAATRFQVRRPAGLLAVLQHVVAATATHASRTAAPMLPGCPSTRWPQPGCRWRDRLQGCPGNARRSCTTRVMGVAAAAIRHAAGTDRRAYFSAPPRAETRLSAEGTSLTKLQPASSKPSVLACVACCSSVPSPP